MSSETKKYGKFVRLAAWGLFAGPIVVLAAERPAGRPGRPEANGAGPDRAIERDRGDGGRAGMGGRPKFPVTDEEWKETEKFLALHAPNRLAFVQKINEGPHKDNLKRVLSGLVRNINALRVQSESIYKLRVEECELDDQIFAICRDLRTAQGAEKQRLLNELRTKITLLFDKGLDERKDRIERLQRMMEEQKKALDKDRETRQQIIDKRYLVISRNGVDGARLNLKDDTTRPKSFVPPTSSPAQDAPE
ncbi:MAG: hypothetical protein JWN51_1484 [Phycisphaerales bacterium]|nr:hypothetical protein [Phycisphaerales bacterium]